jgi:hypothetical protein
MSTEPNQARDRAHLRNLPRCRCGKPATKELWNGLNSRLGVFCDRCATAALRAFQTR